MAAPTQEYPPWLTPVPSVIFDGNGVPITTSTTVLYLPLTYYGPSIPLNPDWTYGGLTPPASTSLPSTSSGISITTTTAIPSSLPPTLTSSATPTTFSSTVSLSSSSATSLPSESSTPTTTPPVAAGQNLSRGQLIGVIVASILGFIFLFIVAILLYLCCKGRRNRRSEEPSFTPVARGLDEGYEIVSADGRTTWAERSPRHSGEEADPFLRRSGAGTPPQPPDPEMGGRTSVPPNIGIARVAVPPLNNGSKSSAGSSATNHSGYGTLIDRPTLNLLPSTTEELDRQRRGHILSPEELQRMDEESVLPLTADYSPLVPPPRLVDPDLVWGSAPKPDRKPSQFSLSAYPDADEAPTVLTARRVRAEDLASRSPPQLTQPLSEGGSSRNSGGFLSSLGLGRLSWFKNLDGGSKRNSRNNSFVASPLSNDDPEIGVALLGPPEMTESQTSRRVGFGLGFDGERPISTASGRSATTVYHDAYSSLPGTPISGGTPVAPLPRALTPSGPASQPAGWPSSSTVAVPDAPATDFPNPSNSYSTGVTNVHHGLPVHFDILDTPAPAPISPFASTTTSSSLSSLRETATGSSAGLSAHPFPPGLTAVPKMSWTDDSSTVTHVNPPISVLSNPNTAVNISFDVLEEAPPSAGEGWRSLAAEQGILNSRRATFGQFVQSPGIASEEASLYSMRSHLSPAHSRSTGSAPASSRRDLSGSASSRPSVFSAAARTHSSGHSLIHSGSISSDARKRGSPAMSAFGSRSRSPPMLSPMLNAPPTAHFVPERAGTHRMAASLDMDIDDPLGGRMSSPEPTSPLSQLSSAPWAGGLDSNWTPT